MEEVSDLVFLRGWMGEEGTYDVFGWETLQDEIVWSPELLLFLRVAREGFSDAVVVHVGVGSS